MDLFSGEHPENENYLPCDGTVNYYGIVFNQTDSDKYYHLLLEQIQWQNDVAVIFGKRIETKRKVAWYGEKEFEYSYSNTTKFALPWTEELLLLKERIEVLTGESYNSCLLNLYHDGSEGMAWHSDGEKDLKKDGAIASLSFGAVRKFSFKHKVTKVRIDMILDHGSLLVMKNATQTNWLHRLPLTTRVKRPRINLTFRTIVVD